MAKAVILCISIILRLATATVETNKRGGHDLFHGLQAVQGGKTSWLEDSRADSIQISRGNANSLFSNTDSSSKKSSLYLQPEPRGLEYLMNVPDQNPFLMNFYRKKRASEKDQVNKILNKRQTNLQSGSAGNVIPGSMGQAVLYGFPSGGLPSLNNGQPFLNNQGIPSGIYQHGGFPQEIPKGINQNGGFSQGPDTHYGGYKTYGY